MSSGTAGGGGGPVRYQKWRLGTKQGELAVQRPEFKKIETEFEDGIARISQRIVVVEVPLVMDYVLQGVQLKTGDKVLMRGDSGAQKWAAVEFRLSSGEAFVLCPESAVLGYRKLTDEVVNP